MKKREGYLIIFLKLVAGFSGNLPVLALEVYLQIPLKIQELDYLAILNLVADFSQIMIIIINLKIKEDYSPIQEIPALAEDFSLIYLIIIKAEDYLEIMELLTIIIIKMKATKMAKMKEKFLDKIPLRLIKLRLLNLSIKTLWKKSLIKKSKKLEKIQTKFKKKGMSVLKD